MKTLTYKEFCELGEELFGDPNPSTWWFICPACAHSQQGKDMLEKYPKKKEYIWNSFYFSCEGRLMKSGKSALYDKPTPETGCDYTNGGLFQLAKTKVKSEDGNEIMVFEFDKSKSMS